MSEFGLTKEDLGNVEELLFVTREIKRLYDKLHLLEVQLKKQSDEYIQVLNNLKRLSEQENDIYENISENPVKNK